MAIFSKKEDKEKKAEAAKEAPKKETKKAAKKTDAPKEKKAKKPSKNIGANLTKAPGRIIKTPRITEKAAYMTMQNAYVFEVAMDATKRDVMTAIEALYKVSPRKVNIVRKSPRAYVARFRNRSGTKAGVKKAYVFLNKGDKIDIA